MLADLVAYIPFPVPHANLPDPFRRWAGAILLEDVKDADQYLGLAIAFLTILAFLQLRAFSKPPIVPLKVLPVRPSVSILFKPDELALSETTKSSSESKGETQKQSSKDDIAGPARIHRVASDLLKSTLSLGSKDPPVRHTKQPSAESNILQEGYEVHLASPTRSRKALDPSRGTASARDKPPFSPKPVETPDFSLDLPDSFAPLLSSSQTEVLYDQLTADLIHGAYVEGEIRMREGRHEIPLDKDSSRPQLILHVPKGGVRLSAVGGVGSDQLSKSQDLDGTISTKDRSCPMVKNAGLVFDPPLPLRNVAPTLIHFPTLFEDNNMPILRQRQIFRMAMDAAISLSSLVERMLWIVESFLQIHLSKVRITPIYKGQKRAGSESSAPEWRLSLAFSGHCLLFGYIPIPFISVILPTVIIPQPHALLENLLTKQPLASARLRRENISEEKIVLAMLDTAESFSAKLEVLATPPAVGVDLTLPGGVSLGLELMHGKDPGAGRTRAEMDHTRNAEGLGPSTLSSRHGSPRHLVPAAPNPAMTAGGASLSSWTTTRESHPTPNDALQRIDSFKAFDANNAVPWAMKLSSKGTISRHKITFHLSEFSLQHCRDSDKAESTSRFSTKGSFSLWKPLSGAQASIAKRPSFSRRTVPLAHRAALSNEADSPSIVSILLYPEKVNNFQSISRFLHYDYAFDVAEGSTVDFVTVTVGAHHPMLNGGNMITTILESVYASGSVTARDQAVLDPIERRRKRNVLRHLPAIDFTCGIQNCFIPPESLSYTDDGISRTFPAMEGGRVMVRLIGGIDTYQGASESLQHVGAVTDGIRVSADYAIESLTMDNETTVKEFPELDIFEGTKLRSLSSGRIGGSINIHLRPQVEAPSVVPSGPNIFNPLEAYEIDFSGSSLILQLKEASLDLGHRRIIFPTETRLAVEVVESVVDMALEGNTDCELSWDFQGLSPILQVAEVGQSPADVTHEKKRQVSLLIAPLRQGRLSLHISSVGGIQIAKAATSREDREGLYDWKFFNALVSPDSESADRLLDVVHDKRTMGKLLQVVELINKDAHRTLEYIITQVWRAKEIFDQEGVKDPGHAIPGHKMARLLSLFMSGDTSQVDVILPIIRRVVAADGLDVVAIKELLRQHCDFYDDWAPEIDRGVRFLEIMFTPVSVPQPYVEPLLTPLAEEAQYAQRFRHLPSAQELYDRIGDRPHLPLDPSFSNLVSRVAPYLDVSQCEYFLQIRSSSEWQPSDLKRLRYVFSVKRKVLEIAESYGGLSFLPQSFLVSVFLGEATRSSLRVAQDAEPRSVKEKEKSSAPKKLTLFSLRQKRARLDEHRFRSKSKRTSAENVQLTPAGRIASLSSLPAGVHTTLPDLDSDVSDASAPQDLYELGDCLLGPSDVAILLQAGLTSVMKGSSVVQLNQRMLLDLIASQPASFAVAVLAEIGTPGGQGSPRGLASALMALLELDQTCFRPLHRLDMHALMESWLPGMKVPRREDYMAGGRWARQSYYEAIFSLATSILEDAECYMAVKAHLQRVRVNCEADPIPTFHDNSTNSEENGRMIGAHIDLQHPKLQQSIEEAKTAISVADKCGSGIIYKLSRGSNNFKKTKEYARAVNLYNEAFDRCAEVLAMDRLAFHSEWFGEFYKRNYDALMIKSLFDNVMEDIDNVRYWLHCLRRGSRFGAPLRSEGANLLTDWIAGVANEVTKLDKVFLQPEKHRDQEIVDAILEAIIYDKRDQARLRDDPLVRLLIPNRPGKYDFTIVTAMGVITEGAKGLELQTAVERLKQRRGVETIRADTATARSFEYNASKIMEAISSAQQLGRPFGLVGYSQGCANALMAENLMISGTPAQREKISSPRTGLVCRQLLFSAANGSRHGYASDRKAQRLIIMWEEFLKYQQGYFSRALQTSFLEILTSLVDSSSFQKTIGGAQSMLHDGARAFWREAQHLVHVPTCTLRGVLEEHTTPESLEMLSNMLTKQSGSALHDSQVHVYDAIGHPLYHKNRNGALLEKCDVGQAAIQRTHHWSPLDEEVSFIATQRDKEMASFDCAKDRHLFPWVDVNVRFGFIKYADSAVSNAEGKEDDNATDL